MGTTITKTPQAQRDLLELADSIAQGSLDAAQRFLDAAEKVFHLNVRARIASVVPPGLMRFLVPANPAINRWAIVGCPYGTRGRTPTNAARRYPRLLGFNQAQRRLSSISPKQSQFG